MRLKILSKLTLARFKYHDLILNLNKTKLTIKQVGEHFRLLKTKRGS